MRAYTPISCDDDLGRLDLLVKVYFAGQNPIHPPGGKLSQYLDGLSVGDEVVFKGPVRSQLVLGSNRACMHACPMRGHMIRRIVCSLEG